jgi:hypothetical protein
MRQPRFITNLAQLPIGVTGNPLDGVNQDFGRLQMGNTVSELGVPLLPRLEMA